jgi:hypothetical protein
MIFGLPVPPSTINDADYWRKRAEEARTIAERMTDAHTKSLMLSVAESYEKIASGPRGTLVSRFHVR